MGYLVRHIHNRDLAGENIMTAYVRLRFILKKYPATQLELVRRLERLDVKMPRGGWTLRLAEETIKIKGALPGQYACVVKPSRRNSQQVDFAFAPNALLQKMRAVCRMLGVTPVTDKMRCKMMLKGVMLNGHVYKQGDRCAYLARVAPRGNAEGVGGRLGSSESYKVGTIKMFYHFPRTPSITFVDILDLPVRRKLRSLYIVAAQPAFPRGFACNPVTATSTLYHIDSITSKVLLAPHYTEDETEATTEMCGIPMWDAR